MMSTQPAEATPNLTAQTVDAILARAATLAGEPSVQETGHIGFEDYVTSEAVSIGFDEASVLKCVRVRLQDPRRHLLIEPEKNVELEMGTASKTLVIEGQVNKELSPKERRQAVGYVATANALFNDLVNEYQAVSD